MHIIVALYRRAQDDEVETEHSYYNVAEKAIDDKSMLGKHAQELCDNLDVYWITETSAREC